MSNNGETLNTALPKELKRVREVMAQYIEIGTQGQLGASMIQDSIDQAEKALKSIDPVARMKIYNELRRIE